MAPHPLIRTSWNANNNKKNGNDVNKGINEEIRRRKKESLLKTLRHHYSNLLKRRRKGTKATGLMIPMSKRRDDNMTDAVASGEKEGVGKVMRINENNVDDAAVYAMITRSGARDLGSALG